MTSEAPVTGIPPKHPPSNPTATSSPPKHESVDPVAVGTPPKVSPLDPVPVAGTPPKQTHLAVGSVSGDERRRRTSSYGSFTRVVVVAIDSSDYAKKAFDWYMGHVWRSDDLIVFVHCPEAPKLPSFTFKGGFNIPVDQWTKILDEMNTGTRRLEEEYDGYCTVKKIKHKVRAEAMKNVGEGILRISQDEKADLIVCGSKGSGKSLFTKGTVAEFVSRNSTIPTLIVPAKAQ